MIPEECPRGKGGDAHPNPRKQKNKKNY
jgi:hypothetical protein